MFKKIPIFLTILFSLISFSVLVIEAKADVKQQEYVLATAYMPWWAKCFGGHDIGFIDVYGQPNVDYYVNHALDFTQDPRYDQRFDYWVDAQLDSMNDAGIKVVIIYWWHQIRTNDCIKRVVNKVVERIDEHPEYGIKYMFAYDTAISGTANELCSSVKSRDIIREDYFYLVNEYINNPEKNANYYMVNVGGVDRSVMYHYAAYRNVNVKSFSCANKVRDFFWELKNIPGQKNRFFLIGDILRKDLNAETSNLFLKAARVFDSYSCFGRNCLGESAQKYMWLSDFNKQKDLYVAKANKRYRSRRVYGERYSMSFVSDVMPYFNNKRLTVIPKNKTDINEAIFLAKRSATPLAKRRNKSGSNKLIILDTWNDYHESTGFEPSGTKSVPWCNTPEFPLRKDDTADYCRGDSFLELIKNNF